MDKKEKIKKVCFIILAVLLSFAFVFICIVSVIGRTDETETASAETLEEVQECNTYIYIPAGTLLSANGTPYQPYTGLLCYVSLDLNVDYLYTYPMAFKISGASDNISNCILFVNPASGIYIINEDILIPCDYKGDIIGDIKFKTDRSQFVNYWYISADDFSLVTVDNVPSYQNGYDSGYNKGLSDNVTLNPVSTFLEPVQTFLDTRLFGGFSIGAALSTALFVGFALIFIKMFAG